MSTGLRITVCVVVLLFVSDGRIVGQGPGAVQNTYVNPIHRWSVSYPDGWQLDSSDPDQVMIKTPPSLPGGLVGIHALPTAWTRDPLDSVADNVLREWGQALQARGQTFRTISRQRVVLANEVPAVEIINLIGVGVVGRSRKVIISRDDHAFLIDAETEDSSWSTLGSQFEQIVNSFTIRTGRFLQVENASASDKPTSKRLMEEARAAAEAQEAYVLHVTEAGDSSGVFVFYNNPRPFCYTYMIPGEWVAAPSEDAFRSKDGLAFVGVALFLSAMFDGVEGPTLIERARNFATRDFQQRYSLVRPPAVELTPFASARPGTWRLTFAPAADQTGRLIGFAPKILVDLSPAAIGQITLRDTADDDGLARRIIETLKTTTDSNCYWGVLEGMASIGPAR